LRVRSRLASLFIVAVVIAIPRVGHVTIVNTQTKYFDGFRISSTWQIGCATTHDYPTQETTDNAQRAQDKLIQETEDEIVKSYKHYLHGDHPFKRFAKALDPARRSDAAPGLMAPRVAARRRGGAQPGRRHAAARGDQGGLRLHSRADVSRQQLSRVCL
jgi:hypothetical protein